MGDSRQAGEDGGERRRSARVAVDVDCQCVDEEFVLLGERLIELSADGALLRADGEAAQIGDVLTISFRPPGSAQWIDAQARVARLVTGTHPGAPGFGLELVELGAFERALLAGSLERARARVPREKPTVRAPLPKARGRVERRPIVRVEPPVPRFSIVVLD